MNQHNQHPVPLEEKKQDFSPSSDTESIESNESISSDISGSAYSYIEENDQPQNATANVADGM